MNHRATPAPATVTETGRSTRDARDDFLARNGFDMADYNASWVTLKLGPIPVGFPNTASRKRVVPFHDLHHVATGFGTDFVGEAEIAAYELRAGCTGPAAYILNGMAFFLGLFIAPRRTLRAWSRSRNTRTLYRHSLGYEQALAMPLGDLRRELGLPEAGLADRPSRLHRDAERRRKQAETN